MKHVYDIAILGDTPAGCAAAYYLARKKCKVALIDISTRGVECPLAEWVPRTLFQIKGLPRDLASQCQAQPFRGVTFHNASLTKRVNHRLPGAMGYFVQAEAFNRHLKQLARKAGAEVRAARTHPALRLQEEFVEVAGTTVTHAKLLIIAHSRPNEIFGDLSLPIRTVPQSSLAVTALEAPLADRKALRAMNGALHVVESPERTELGLFFAEDKAVHIRIISTSKAAGNRATELSAMIANLQKHALLPPGLQLEKARGAVWTPPAGVSLELETHVAKRCLLAGTAGGFADSITGQTFFPSIQSALLAADVAFEALHAKDPQDTLMKFKSSWRKTLADLLRPPNTALHMLLPLLFVNNNIIPKVARALLYGENI